MKLTPHGPAHAVLVADSEPIHGPAASAGGGGITTSCGWPVRARVMSISGPLGPIFHGVWQSLQPIVFTRYAPRSRGVRWGPAAGSVWSTGAAAVAIRVVRAAPVSARISVANRCVVMLSSVVRVK